MKKIKLIPALIILLFTSCATMQSTTLEKSSEQRIEADYLVLHTPGKIYMLTDYQFSDDFLTGELKKFKGRKNNVLHVYTNQLSIHDLTYQSSIAFEIPRNQIRKIAYRKFSLGKTLALTGSIIAAGIIGATNYTFKIGPMDII